MIATIHVEAWRAAYRGIVPDEFLDSLSIDRREATWREILLTGNEAVWVAQESETIVGWISAAASRDADAGASTGEIWAVYVTPGHWGKGVGRSLCESAERHSRLGGFIEVTLWVLRDNERAVKFYQSNGFIPNVGQMKGTNIAVESSCDTVCGMAWRFFKAVFRYWWAWMSCALYTFLGVYIAAAGKPNDWIVRASLILATAVLAIAFYLSWAEQTRKVDELTSRADIKGHIYGGFIVENPRQDLFHAQMHSRIIISAFLVNKSPLVSPTIRNFICRLSLQDGETLEIPYDRDLSVAPGVTHRDESGRPIGDYPSLAYFNHSGLVKDQHREGSLRFEVMGRFIRQEFTSGSLELIVIDGGGNQHVIGKLKWPYVRDLGLVFSVGD